jgi:hypothetical protein
MPPRGSSEFEEAYPIAQDLPDSIDRALARLKSSTKGNASDSPIDRQRRLRLANASEGAGEIAGRAR